MGAVTPIDNVAMGKRGDAGCASIIFTLVGKSLGRLDTVVFGSNTGTAKLLGSPVIFVLIGVGVGRSEVVTFLIVMGAVEVVGDAVSDSIIILVGASGAGRRTAGFAGFAESGGDDGGNFILFLDGIDVGC